mgnify:FL=1
MYLNQLTPKNNVLSYIPDYLVNDDVQPEMLPVLSQLLSKKMSMEECYGLLSELSAMHTIARNEHPDFADGTKGTWFSTPEVVDVRLFFREYNKSHNNGGCLGSKMRLYSVGKSRDGDESIQGIDSGFITYNSYATPQVVFQSALAKTMLYNSLYAIGSRATVRKINEVNKNRSSNTEPTTYKWLSALRPLKTDGIDQSLFTHILHPAAYRAGIDNPDEFFSGFDGGNKVLDRLLNVLLESHSMEDLQDNLTKIKGLELFEEDVEAIVEDSNSAESNLDGAADFRNDKAEGINIVTLMEHIGDIYGE